jgi:hypothetical protein
MFSKTMEQDQGVIRGLPWRHERSDAIDDRADGDHREP